MLRSVLRRAGTDRLGLIMEQIDYERNRVLAQCVKRYSELSKLIGNIPCEALPGRDFGSFTRDTQERRFNALVCERFASRLIDRFLAEDQEAAARGICMVGNSGAGKSHLASAIYFALCQSEVYPVYLRASRFFNYFKGASGREINALIDAFSRVPCLMLDEVGRSTNSAFENDTLLDVFDSRIRDGVPTVLIANLRLENLKAALGEAIASRAMPHLYTLPFNGSDYRLVKAMPANYKEAF